MDFAFTEEQLMIQDVARRIAQEKIAPSAEHHDKTGEFPLENIRLLGENGLMGIEVPAEYGGAGMDPISYVLAMIEIAEADCAHSTIVSVNNSLFCNGILKFGTEAQKQKYVRAIAEGKEIGAFALTEPQSGSDATAMRCKAVKQADGTYVINGKKSWITSGPVAKYIILFAITDPSKGAKGITAFMIDTAKPGFHRGKTEPKLGIRASATCEIEFQDYVAQASEVLGEEGILSEGRSRGEFRSLTSGRLFRIERCMLVGKQRIATDRRNLDSIKAGARGRTRLKAPVAVPVLRKQRRRLLGLALHRNHVFAARYRRDERIFAKPAERIGEALEIVIAHLLTGKCQHMVLQPRRADFRDFVRRQRLRQVDARH